LERGKPGIPFRPCKERGEKTGNTLKKYPNGEGGEKPKETWNHDIVKKREKKKKKKKKNPLSVFENREKEKGRGRGVPFGRGQGEGGKRKVGGH